MVCIASINYNNLSLCKQYFWFKKCFIIKFIFAFFRTIYHYFLEILQPTQKKQAVGLLIVYLGSAALHHCLKNPEKHPIAHP